ncbi:MAG: DUF4870 domain-containing protein [Dehalococcoidia bacterium]
MKSESRTSDEKLWAAVAHGSILINLIPVLFGLSAVIAVGIWLFHRGVSAYVGYQALQAVIFQVVFLFIVLVTPITALALALLIAGIGYGLYVAFQCFNGRDSRYVWIGKLITSYLTRE